MVRVQHLKTVDELNVAAMNDAGPFFVDADGVRLRHGRLEDDLFEVQDDLRDVLDHVAHGRELVQGALDSERRDGGTLER